MMKDELKGKRGEDAVAQLASRTYLKYWCYPSPVDNEKNENEICDLLILFKNTAIVIEVKNYEFKGNYARYFNNTLKKAYSQVKGAERKLNLVKKNLSLNHAIKGTYEFDPKSIENTIKIIVNLNTDPLFYPGCLDDEHDNFAHVFNWFAFLKIVKELDAIPDFIEYLNVRQEQFSQKHLLIASGQEDEWTQNVGEQFQKYVEELITSQMRPVNILSNNELDLLARYLTDGRSFKSLQEASSNHMSLIQLDKSWQKYSGSKSVRLKSIADQDSYFFDKFIRKEVLYYDKEERVSMAAQLLGLNRFERRIAGKSLKEFLISNHKIAKDFTARRFSTFGDLALGYFVHGSDIDLQTAMRLMETAALGYSHHENYISKKVVIIGMDSELTQTKLVYIDEVVELHDTDKNELEKDLNLLGWFTNIEEVNWKFDEYPEK